jgi:putative Mn2+ efflux pump MntP
MGLIALLLLGIGLSFDTFAVSVGCGIIEREIKFLQAARIAIFFAVFQAVMPLLGWVIGYSVRDIIEPVDHWIAFVLLSAIGGKMIVESFKTMEEKSINPKDLKVILLMSLATTIDAFVVGITFALFNVNLLFASFIIGSVTFIAAMLGMLFGKKLGAHLGQKMEILGGIILVVLGLKILIEHIY